MKAKAATLVTRWRYQGLSCERQIIELIVRVSEPKTRRQKFANNLSFLDPHDRRGEEEGKDMARVVKVSTYILTKLILMNMTIPLRLLLMMKFLE